MELKKALDILNDVDIKEVEEKILELERELEYWNAVKCVINRKCGIDKKNKNQVLTAEILNSENKVILDILKVSKNDIRINTLRMSLYSELSKELRKVKRIQIVYRDKKFMANIPNEPKNRINGLKYEEISSDIKHNTKLEVEYDSNKAILVIKNILN